jgi:hypothetical protein
MVGKDVMQTPLYHAGIAQNACALACTGYGTQPCCPPLIVIATTLNEEQEIRNCIFRKPTTTSRGAEHESI